MKLLLIPNDPLRAYSDMDRWLDRPRGYEERGIDVRVFPTGALTPTPHNIAKIILKEKIDVVRTLEGGLFIISNSAAEACRCEKVPLVVSLHGNPWEIARARGYDYETLKRTLNRMRFALNNASLLFVVQKSMVYYLHREGYSAEFLPNYVMPYFREVCEPDSEVIYVGRMDQDKDIYTVLSACEILDLDPNDVTFIGSGPPEVEADIRKSGYMLVDSVRNSRLPYYYSSAKVLLQAFRYISGFSIPVLEAQACARPVVLSRLGFTKEVLHLIEPRHDVEFFMEPEFRVFGPDEMAFAIEHLMSSWNYYSRRAKERSKNFSRDKILDKEVEKMKEVV